MFFHPRHRIGGILISHPVKDTSKLVKKDRGKVFPVFD
jgi:hypothetical protein